MSLLALRSLRCEIDMGYSSPLTWGTTAARLRRQVAAQQGRELHAVNLVIPILELVQHEHEVGPAMASGTRGARWNAGSKWLGK